LNELHKQGAQLRHVGRLDGVRPSFIKKIERGVDLTKDNDKLILNVAFNYGGRDEIVHVIKKMIDEGLDPDQVDPELIESYLFTYGSPDPDLVIRTSGEKRTSNFLLWQSAYSEWYFPMVFWPDFNRNELIKAIREYSQRNRRFGLVTS
jgi:undecaprenyl diphosphate synthase